MYFYCLYFLTFAIVFKNAKMRLEFSTFLICPFFFCFCVWRFTKIVKLVRNGQPHDKALFLSSSTQSRPIFTFQTLDNCSEYGIFFFVFIRKFFSFVSCFSEVRYLSTLLRSLKNKRRKLTCF